MRLLIICLSIVITLTANLSAQTFTFPDSTGGIEVFWNHEMPEPILFKVYANGYVIAQVENQLFVDIDRARFLADSSNLFVTASDMVGNESGGSNVIQVNFQTEIIPPLSTDYYADAARLWSSWVKGGAMSYSEGDTIIQMFGYDVGSENMGKLSKVLPVETGRYEIMVWGSGTRLVVSVDGEYKTILADGPSPYRLYFDVTAGNRLVTMQPPEGGGFDIAAFQLKSYDGEVDTTPPDDPWGTGARGRNERE